MDRGEPTLVPQWLRGTGSGSGNSGSSHHSLDISQNDAAGLPPTSRHRHTWSQASAGPSLNSSRKELSSIGNEHGNSDRDGFSNSQTYPSFRQSSSSRVCSAAVKEDCMESLFPHGLDESDKNKFHGPYDISRRWSSSPPSKKSQNDAILWRSQSVVSGAYFENPSTKHGTDTESGVTMPAVHSGPSMILQNAFFEKKFPCLGTVGRQDKEIAVSTVLASSSSPIAFVSKGSNAGSDTWRSALADPPAPYVASAAHQVGKHGSVLGSGLNMAEVVLQNTHMVRCTEFPLEIQRTEEMTLKCSRQLIPMTPGMAKATGLGFSNRSKAKALRPKDTPTAAQLAKSGHHHLGSSSRSFTQGGGRLLILKPVRVAKPLKADSTVVLEGVGLACSTTTCSEIVGTPNCKNKLFGFKRSIFKQFPPSSSSSCNGPGAADTVTMLRCNGVIHGGVEEKRRSASFATQNRSDFFNSLRKKAVAEDNISNNNSSSTNISASENGISPSMQRESNNCNDLDVVTVEKVIITSPANSEEKEEVCSNNFVVGETSKDEKLVCCVKVSSEEEEAAFLRLLGWEEDAGGGEPLTEEEISAFYQEHCRAMNSKNILQQGKKAWNLSTRAMRVGGTSD